MDSTGGKRTITVTDEEVLLMHASGRPGKIEIRATKPLTTQRDLSLAYSPGVAVPCREIARDPALAYDYTAKGNLAAVITKGKGKMQPIKAVTGKSVDDVIAHVRSLKK